MTATAPLLSTASETSASPRRSIPQIATAVSLIAGIVLRWAQLGKKSLWFDEGYTAWVVSHPLREIIRLIGADTAPPGYYILLRGWVILFGSSETALRSMSALASSLALLVFWRVALQILKNPPAIAVATAVFAFGYMQVGYSHECRFYALMSLLGVVDFYLVMLVCQGSTPMRLLALAICWSISLYLNNVMAIYLACLGGAWLLLPGSRPVRHRLIDAAIVTAIAAAAFAPWLPRVLAQSKALKGNFWPDTPDFWLVNRTIAVFAGVDERTFDEVDCRGFYWSVHAMDWLQVNAFYWIVFAMIAGGLITAVFTRRWRWPAVLALLGVGPILIVFIYSLIGQSIFMDRAFMGSSFAVPLLVALPLTLRSPLPVRREKRGDPATAPERARVRVSSDLVQLPETRSSVLHYAPADLPAKNRFLVRLARITSTIWLVLLAIMIAPSLWSQRLSEHSEDWRTLSALAAPHPGHRQLTVFVANEGELLYDYYARQGDYTPSPDRTGTPADYFAIDPPHTMIRVKTDADVEALRHRLDRNDFDEVVLVASHRWFADHDDRTFKLLDGRYKLVESWTAEKIIAEYRFSVRP
jgi:hypothetical protein